MFSINAGCCIYDGCSESNTSYFMLAHYVAVEVEPSHQYSVTFCCCVIDGNRWAV